MRRVFSAGRPFRVPDGTLVAPLFNPLDTLSGLPADLAQGFSVAQGLLPPGTRSAIHLMPHVTQFTFVLTGRLDVRMKSSSDARPYTLALRRHQAALTPAGTFVQLINRGTSICRVFYVVSPSYIFEWRDGAVHYDDAVSVPGTWAALARRGWHAGVVTPSRRTRAHAAARLRQKPIPKWTP